jgi:uncharacterized membrane protein
MVTDRVAPAGRAEPRGLLDWAFLVGIIGKGLDGLVELAGGILLLALSPATIDRLVAGLTRHELSKDPTDWVATHLVRLAQGLTGSTARFVGVYLLAHGVVKVALVAAVLRDRRWAYPWLIAFLVAFIGYQLYRIAVAPTPGLALLTVFDAVVAWLTWREYRRRWPRRPPTLTELGPRAPLDTPTPTELRGPSG